MAAKSRTAKPADPPPMSMVTSSMNSNAANDDDDDDEKYGKIRTAQAESRKYLLGFFVVCVLIAGYFIIVQPQGSPAAQIGGSAGSAESPIQMRRVAQADAATIADLEGKQAALDAEVREIKKTGVIMETDPHSLEVTKKLQDVTRKLIVARYGDHPSYRIKVTLEFPPTIPDYAENGKDGELLIEMAPIDLIPVSVFTFLEVARSWEGGEFHRNAGHVLQATTHSSIIKNSLPFQEYSKDFPHLQGTTGYCGRPSGPCWYVSIKNNSVNHGPGSQQKKNPHEADANFGKIVQGMDDVVPRIHSTKESGWLSKPNQVKILTMTVLVPTGPGGSFEPWQAEG
eukprot:CAMPEP_0119548246 /NCGR_PEP_ID=MMETSP1352-20130426/2199_1 /TAXON_ID=265584 /ORGANISM="Stauroneis constricta, Strain CCMP1120" /LENGTH=340 /DNA_ID=CAMNT_0007593453 /DNA_START=100 /DNA_END=1122 /DNA_ORIENTATION=-